VKDYNTIHIKDKAINKQMSKPSMYHHMNSRDIKHVTIDHVTKLENERYNLKHLSV